MERKLRYIEGELKKDNVAIPDVSELPKAPNPREIIDLEVIPWHSPDVSFLLQFYYRGMQHRNKKR